MNHHQKGFIAPLFLALIAILLIGGGEYVYLQNKQESQSGTANSDIQTADWKTYTNTKYGFEVKYPNGYSDNSDNSGGSFRSLSCKQLTGGGEWPTDCQAYDVVVQQNKLSIDGFENYRISVAGIQAEKFIQYNGMWDNMTQVVVQFQKGQNWYIQTFTFNNAKSKTSEEVMNQILSTFKFNP